MNEIEFTVLKAALVFVVTCIVTFVGAGTGGSAMFTIPLCILLGWPPSVSIATTRVGAFFSMLGAFAGFSKHKKIDYKIGAISSAIAGLGAYLGSYWLLVIPPDYAKKSTGVLMVAVLSFSILRKRNKNNNQNANNDISLLRKTLGYLSFFIIGCLGGAFGGQGIMLVYTLTLFFGLDFFIAAGTRVVISFFITLISLFTYFNSGSIHWQYGILFAVASLLGTYFGANYSIKKGEGIRPLKNETQLDYNS